MKSRSYRELGLGAKAQVRPRSWTKILTESWTSAGPSPRVYLVALLYYTMPSPRFPSKKSGEGGVQKVLERASPDARLSR